MLDPSIVSIVMPILTLIALFALALIVVRIVAGSGAKRALNLKSFEELARELKEDHAKIHLELAAIQEVLSSIDKMMKEIG